MALDPFEQQQLEAAGIEGVHYSENINGSRFHAWKKASLSQCIRHVSTT